MAHRSEVVNGTTALFTINAVKIVLCMMVLVIVTREKSSFRMHREHNADNETVWKYDPDYKLNGVDLEVLHIAAALGQMRFTVFPSTGKGIQASLAFVTLSVSLDVVRFFGLIKEYTFIWKNVFVMLYFWLDVFQLLPITFVWKWFVVERSRERIARASSRYSQPNSPESNNQVNQQQINVPHVFPLPANHAQNGVHYNARRGEVNLLF